MEKVYLYEVLGDYENAYETSRSIEGWCRSIGYKFEEQTARKAAENYYTKKNS